MVKIGRIENVAKIAHDLVCVREKSYELTKKALCPRNLSHVDVIGFGFGAYFASRTCEYLRQLSGRKVRLLLGIYSI